MNFSISLNVQELQRRGISQEKIERLRQSCVGLTPEKARQSSHPELLLLKGPNGEIAYLRHETTLLNGGVWSINPTYREPGKPFSEDIYILVIEIPLSATIREQRQWIEVASRFYKPSVASKRSLVAPGHLPEWIKKGGFRKKRRIESGPKKFILFESPFSKVRKRSKSDATWQAVSGNRQAWLVREYFKLSPNRRGNLHRGELDIWETLQKRLYRLPRNYFGEWLTRKRNPYKLQAETIQRIVYRALSSTR